MADVVMPDGIRCKNTRRLALETTAQQMLKQLARPRTANNTKAHKDLLDRL